MGRIAKNLFGKSENLVHYCFGSFGIVYIFLALVLVFGACKKEDNEPSLPTGWQEGMKGKILYSANTSNSSNDRLFAIDANGQLSMMSSADHGALYGVSWSPDGNRLAYVSQGAIKIMNADGSGDTTILDQEYARIIDWSDKGKKLVFSANFKISYVKPDGTGFYKTSIYGPNYYGEGSLDWSPDASKVLMYSFGAYHYAKVQTFKPGVSTTLSEIDFDNKAHYPTWSPDGNSILFTSYDDDGRGQLLTSDVDGSNVSRIITFTNSSSNYGFNLFQSSWSPDGKMVAVGSTDGIYIVDLEGTIISLIPKEHGYGIYWVDWH